MITNELCALIGHDLASTAENTDVTFWLVPPSVCVRCRCEFEGHEGVPPASRPRDRDTGQSLMRVATKRAQHA